MRFIEHTKNSNQADVLEALCGVEDAIGFIPNTFKLMAESPNTVNAYLMLKQKVDNGNLSREYKNLAMLTTSYENGCNYCAAAHLTTAEKLNFDKHTISNLLEDKAIADSKHQAFVTFIKQLINNKGEMEGSQVENFLAAGFSKEDIFECVLIVTLKTLSNKINSITNPVIDEEFEKSYETLMKAKQ